MGEQACLRRSFSHPSSASRENKEGNPIRALTESISFGRFMSEPLAWEKWSTFSHNRYLEEAEMFSKPGSVAQMKAYFEAHYKNRAAKKAAALPEQQNASTVNIPEAENAEKAYSSYSVDSKSTMETSDNKKQNEDAHFAYANTSFSNGQRDLYENLNKSDTASPMDSESVLSKGDNNQEIIGVQDTRPAYFARANGFGLNGQTDLSENAQTERCDKVEGESAEFENPPKVKTPRQPENSENNNKLSATTEDNMRQKEAAEKENVALPANKRRMNSSSKLSSQTKATKLPKSSANQVNSMLPKSGASAAFGSKKSAGSLVDKKGLTPKSVHMSINFGSQSRETSESSLRMSKGSSTTPKNSIRASVYRERKFPPSILPSSEERSCSNSSNPSGSKAQCPIASSPFSLKCEERALRRKEFFKMLEEKNSAKEAEKMHLQEKAVQDPKRAQQRMFSRGKPYDVLHPLSQSPGNHTKKMPLTRPRSPKLGRKPIPSTVQESSFRRPAVSTENSEHATLKINQRVTRSIISLPKRKSSPNIQR